MVRFDTSVFNVVMESKAILTEFICDRRRFCIQLRLALSKSSGVVISETQLKYGLSLHEFS